MATRPPTLWASVTPVLVGTAAAVARGYFLPLAFVAALLSALFIQIGANLANDLFDFRRGADAGPRLGPTRVTQAGLLRPAEVAAGMWLAFGVAALLGLYLVYVRGWAILAIGLASIAAGLMYTGGPWPFGYHGLGDLFSFVFFGLVAVMGTYYVHTGTVDELAVLASIPVSLLVTAILVVNNLRDVETDRAAGKRTLAVLIGARATRLQYGLFVAGSLLMPLVLRWAGLASGLFWLPWLTLPLAVRLVRTVTTETGPALNRALKGTAELEFLFGLLFAVSLIW